MGFVSLITNHGLTVITTANLITDLVLNTALVAESGWKIHQLMNQKEPLTGNQKIQLVTEALFAILESANVTVGGCRLLCQTPNNAHIFKAIQLGTTSSAGVVRIGKVVARPELDAGSRNLWEIIGVVIIVGSEVLETAISEPHFCCREEGGRWVRVEAGEPHRCSTLHTWGEGASLGSKLIGNVATLIKKADDPNSFCSAISKWMIDQKKKSKALIWNLPEKNAENAEETRDVPVFRFGNMVNVTREGISRCFEQMYQSIQNWSELLTIPDEISEDPVLQEFKCGITNRCIRFIVAPEEVGVYYEQAEVDRYLNELKPPPGWPSDIEFSRENVKPNRSLQKVIDGRLSKIAQAWKENWSICRDKDHEQAI